VRYPALLGGTAGFLAADFGDQAVSHNASGHASNSWLENDGQPAEELWCPLWEEPVTFQELRDELARVALLPLPRQLRTGTDFALFASQLGRRHGLSGFAR
jgi:CRISPR-associated protein Csx17